MANFLGLGLDHRLEYMSQLSDFFVYLFMLLMSICTFYLTGEFSYRITFCMTHSMHACMEKLRFSSAVKGNDLTLNNSNELEFVTTWE